MRVLNYFKKLLLISVLGGFLSPLAALGVANPISIGYVSTTKIEAGSLVSADSSGEKMVQLANKDNIASLLGVAVSSGTTVVSITDGLTDVQVVTQGITEVFVSDINGDLKVGDKITASPINGVGMKATSNVRIIGQLQKEPTANTAKKVQVKDKEGSEKEVSVYKATVLVKPEYYAGTSFGSSFIPEPIQILANTIAGKDVSFLRLMIATIIFLLSVISVGILLNSSVRNSIISIGRNPLSEYAVQKSLVKVVFLALGILAAMVTSIYAILKI